jgi:hypothetical protein
MLGMASGIFIVPILTIFGMSISELPPVPASFLLLPVRAASFFNERASLPIAPQLVTAGIGLFILLPILRVILIFTIYLKNRGYLFAVALFLCS